MTRYLSILVLFLALPILAFAQSRLHASLEIRDGRVSGLVLALSDEYRVPAREIYRVRDAGLCDDDLREVLTEAGL